VGLLAGEHSIKNFLCCNGGGFWVYILTSGFAGDLKVCVVGGVWRIELVGAMV
jgi:hypothetical protein